MSKRPPNEFETRLHQAALASSKKEITAKQAEAIISDDTERQNALNFLLAVGLLKSLTNSAGKVSFRAVSKEEIVATKGLSGEENLVLGHIKTSGNEGIWTKHLKAKTSLHQTVIDRCLKTLTQKRLIKRVPSVQHITRKIYMLEGIEPSISLTGGPWYTDNELDLEFIQNLTDACHKLISDISFPKRKSGSERLLYPISNAPKYPTADNIRHSLRKARLTETDLSIEHVEMLLNVLILDGKIERLPAFGPALWNPEVSDSEAEVEDEKTSQKKKRKIKKDDSDDEDLRKKKKRKRKKEESESESDTQSSDGRSRSKSKNGRKRKKPSHSSDSESTDSTERRRRKKGKMKMIKSESDASSNSEGEKPKKKPKKAEVPMEFDDNSGGSIYRALTEATTTNGLTEAPCGICPSFEFCKEGGPVNPSQCVYYGAWLLGGTLVNEETQI